MPATVPTVRASLSSSAKGSGPPVWSSGGRSTARSGAICPPLPVHRSQLTTAAGGSWHSSKPETSSSAAISAVESTGSTGAVESATASGGSGASGTAAAAPTSRPAEKTRAVPVRAPMITAKVPRRLREKV